MPPFFTYPWEKKGEFFLVGSMVKISKFVETF